MSKVIYTKLYPHKSALEKKHLSMNKNLLPAKEDFLEQSLEKTEWIPIPNRLEKSQYFIALAKQYSEETETAVEITQGVCRIFARFFFDRIENFGEEKNSLGALILASDSIEISHPSDNGRNIITLLLSLKTHEHFLSEKEAD